MTLSHAALGGSRRRPSEELGIPLGAAASGTQGRFGGRRGWVQTACHTGGHRLPKGRGDWTGSKALNVGGGDVGEGGRHAGRQAQASRLRGLRAQVDGCGSTRCSAGPGGRAAAGGRPPHGRCPLTRSSPDPFRSPGCGLGRAAAPALQGCHCERRPWGCAGRSPRPGRVCVQRGGVTMPSGP